MVNLCMLRERNTVDTTKNVTITQNVTIVAFFVIVTFFVVSHRCQAIILELYYDIKNTCTYNHLIGRFFTIFSMEGLQYFRASP